ncbi:unnamed protein product [Cochlearia groenlandica]
MCYWSIGGPWKEVRGLKSLGDKYKRNDGSSGNTTKLGSCGGKLLLIWEAFPDLVSSWIVSFSRFDRLLYPKLGLHHLALPYMLVYV